MLLSKSVNYCYIILYNSKCVITMKKLHIIPTCFLVFMSLGIHAETNLETTPEVYSLWEQYYKAESSNSIDAENLLKQIMQKTPNDPKLWKTWAYLEIKNNNNALALDYVNRSLQLNPADEQLQIQKAYLLNGAHKNNEALVIFKKLQNSSNPEIATQSKQAVVNLSGTSKQTFTDIYFSPSYEGRYDDLILPLKVRYGRYFAEENRGQIYAFGVINRDTRSKGGARPEIIDQNSAIIGLGVNYRPWEWPIYMYLEAGGSYDLINLNRKKFRESINVGLTGYQEWYWQHNQVSHSPVKQQNQYFVETYGNAAAYSREDYNFITDLRLRNGWNFNRNDIGNIQAYLKLHTINDTNHKYYNNLAEIGPGLAWQPAGLPLKLRVEQMYGKYVNGTPASVKGNFDNTRFEVTFYRSF